MGGVISPFGNPALPTGPAGGDLAGTYPSPTVVAAHSPVITGQTSITSNLTPVLQITGTTNGQDLYTANGNDTTTHAFKGQVSGDSNGRFTVGVGGDMMWGPGSAGRDTALARTAVGVLSLTQGSFTVTTAGNGLAVKEGANAKQGTAVLVAGSVVVANTAVTAASRILLTSQVDGGAPGFLRVSTRTAGTSFTITSGSGTDTSTVAYQIFEPA